LIEIAHLYTLCAVYPNHANRDFYFWRDILYEYCLCNIPWISYSVRPIQIGTMVVNIHIVNVMDKCSGTNGKNWFFTSGKLQPR
jgi:hypothetical protein